VTDIRYTEENLRALELLLAGVDILFIESVFLDRDRPRRTQEPPDRHAGGLDRAAPRRPGVVPFHFSPRYEGRAAELQAEVQAAWRGTRGA